MSTRSQSLAALLSIAIVLGLLGLLGLLGCTDQGTVSEGAGVTTQMEGTGDGDGDPSGDGDGDPAGDGDPTGDGEHATTAGDGDASNIVCVEMDPGVVTCWADYWNSTWLSARVMLECQVADAVNTGVWSDPYKVELPVWGSVLCHDIVSTDRAVCLLGDDQVILTETVEGWAPELSDMVSQYEPTEPPCGP